MDLGLKGKKAIVCASSKGLGKACALALAEEGVDVILNARSEAQLIETRNFIRDNFDVRVEAIAGDVTDENFSVEFVKEAYKQFGDIDIAILNAGGPPPIGALEITENDIRVAIERNFISGARIALECLPKMQERNFGRVLAIASSSIVQAITSLPLSTSSRIALWAWAKTAAYALGSKDLNVTINLLCPGSHATDRMKELNLKGRLGDPADFGKVAAFLCSDFARFINGAKIVIDGGQTLAL